MFLLVKTSKKGFYPCFGVLFEGPEVPFLRKKAGLLPEKPVFSLF
jgi:hypothetical protein